MHNFFKFDRTGDDDIDLGQVVIPGLTWGAMFFWISAFGGMTRNTRLMKPLQKDS
jgi:hypothetical protein